MNNTNYHSNMSRVMSAQSLNPDANIKRHLAELEKIKQSESETEPDKKKLEEKEILDEE